ncbi:beta-1,4-mannooligosaccharide phosphorylase [uncultured archaeon]|nr:beta-1,4-mannooligosaccharide phosphorylase [uncultured archaeon]
MGRTQPERTLTKELRKKIQESESSKKEYSDYLSKLEKNYSKGKISYAKYVETLHEKRNGRNIKEWIDYLGKYEKDCKNRITKEKTKNATKGIVTLVLSFAVIGFLFFLISNNGFSFIGFAIQNGPQDFSQQLNLTFANSTNYELYINQTGTLSSLKLSGNVEGNGTIKIYFENLLSYEYSGELNSGVLPENLSPSQGEPLSSVNFFQFCNQTCDLSNLSLNKTFYELRIEISDAQFTLDKVDYTINPVSPIVQQNFSQNITSPQITNITQNISQNITSTNVSENLTTGTAQVETTQYQAVLGKPVKWKKQIISSNAENLTINVPADASNVNINEIDNKNKSKATTFKQQNKNKLNFNTKKNSQYEVNYETPAPYAVEKNINNGKEVQIKSSGNDSYPNIISFTTLDKKLNIKDPSKIKIYSKEENAEIPIQNISDTNHDGIYDYVEWIAPQSNETFEIIIEISKAQHLDSGKNFISDIYEQVKAQDGIWSENINNNEYVRVTFTQNLTNQNDITIFPRIISGNPTINVYEQDNPTMIASFTNLTSNAYNKILLTNLISSSQDVFDLKILGGVVQFDYIVDPQAQPTGAGGTSLRPQKCGKANRITLWNITFRTACNGSYPSICAANTTGADYLSCALDGNETSGANQTAYAGINATYYNTTITNCASIKNVFLCYKWSRKVAGQSFSNCAIRVDANGEKSFTNVSTTCPIAGNTSAESCINITSVGESWTCSNFFGSSGTRATAQEYVRSSNTTAAILVTEALYFNVTYYTNTAPNVSTLFNPVNDSVSTSNTIWFGGAFNSSNGLQNLTLYINNDTSSTIYASNTTLAVAANVFNNFTNVSVSVPNGNWSWNWLACDIAGNCAFNTTSNYSFHISQNAPRISITYPTNNTNWSNNNLDINYSVLGNWTSISSCWYSNDTYVANTSLGATCSNITTVIWTDAISHNVTIWVNDTNGLVNSSKISFGIDTINPNVNITYPTNNSNFTTTNISINYSASNIGLQACWYSNDSYSINTTLPNCRTNITSFLWAQGQHQITVWANDSDGNMNSSTINFTVDSIPPAVNITSPINNTVSTNSQLEIDYTRSDSGQGISSCWFSNDTNVVNITLANCANLTTGTSTTTSTANMTGYSSPSPNQVWATADYTAGGSAVWEAFDTVNGYPQAWYGYNNGLPAANLTYDFGSGNGKIITSYNLSCGHIPQPAFYLPTDWTFRGSNDNATWTILDSHVADNTISVAGQFYNFSFSNTNSYRYYMIAFTGITFDSPIIREMYMYTSNPISAWSSGQHSVTIWVNDSFGNLNKSVVNFNISGSDTTPPYFTNFANQTIYTNQSLSYNMTASDNVAVDSFAINWTNTFSITKDGNLTNTSALSAQAYYINVSVNDTTGNLNSSILRVNVLNAADSFYPQFSGYWEDNASLNNSGIGHFNVTLSNTNGTVWLQVTVGDEAVYNITATNTSGSANVFNATYNFGFGQVYNYTWISWGNGVNNNYNSSGMRRYTVNRTAPTYLSILYNTPGVIVSATGRFSDSFSENNTLANNGVGSYAVDFIPPDGTIQNITYQLNSTYNITQINLANTGLEYNTNKSRLWGSADGVTYVQLANETLTNFTGSTAVWDNVSFAPTMIKYIKWEGLTFVPVGAPNRGPGLGEIQFYFYPTAPLILTVNITSPINNTQVTDNFPVINYTFYSASGISSCWYSNDTNAVNISLAPGWVKESTNPVFPPTQGWEGTVTAEPSIIYENGVFKMWYRGNSGTSSRIGYATSTDGLTWTKYGSNPLSMSLNGNTAIYYPYVLKVGSYYYMYTVMFPNNNVFRFNSSDGITWNLENGGNPVISASGSGWEGSYMDNPAIYYDSATGVWQMLYEASLSFQIGYANSTDGLTWTKYAGNPVLPQVSSSWKSTFTGNPELTKINGMYYAFYGGSDGNGWKIGWSNSSDLIHWSDYSKDPILNGTSGQWDYLAPAGDAADPSIAKNESQGQLSGVQHLVAMYYSGAQTQVGLAYLQGISYQNYLETLSSGSSLPVCGNLTDVAWSQGQHNVTIWVNDTLGNLNKTTITFNVSAPSNNIPQITFVSPISDQDPTENATTPVIFNVTVYDADGAGDINITGVSANFTRSEEAVRLNSTCSKLTGQDLSNSYNFSCSISMWYWDENGTWNISVGASDNESNSASNLSTTFTYNPLKAFVLSPLLVTWTSLTPAGINITSNQNTTLNNTGNVVINSGHVQVLGVDMQGIRDNTQYLLVNNITASWDNTLGMCRNDTHGRWLINATYISVPTANLTRGNVSALNGTGQEMIYYCIPSVPKISSQTYATNNSGAWTIRITLALLIPRKRKKEKQIKDDKLFKAFNLITEELKEEYSQNKANLLDIIIGELKNKYNIGKEDLLELAQKKEEIQIPISIFSKDLGCLEAISKYMKENLNMNYKKIAEEISRDERTIWTSYKKATEKQKEPFEIKEGLGLPISIFKNNKLTILESLVYYLRNMKMKYSEIAEILNRDERNIWTTYSRITNKMK